MRYLVAEEQLKNLTSNMEGSVDSNFNNDNITIIINCSSSVDTHV